MTLNRKNSLSSTDPPLSQMTGHSVQSNDSTSPIVITTPGNISEYIDSYLVVTTYMGEVEKFEDPIVKNMLSNRYMQCERKEGLFLLLLLLLLTDDDDGKGVSHGQLDEEDKIMDKEQAQITISKHANKCRRK